MLDKVCLGIFVFWWNFINYLRIYWSVIASVILEFLAKIFIFDAWFFNMQTRILKILLSLCIALRWFRSGLLLHFLTIISSSLVIQFEYSFWLMRRLIVFFTYIAFIALNLRRFPIYHVVHWRTFFLLCAVFRYPHAFLMVHIRYGSLRL